MTFKGHTYLNNNLISYRYFILLPLNKLLHLQPCDFLYILEQFHLRGLTRKPKLGRLCICIFIIQYIYIYNYYLRGGFENAFPNVPR